MTDKKIYGCHNMLKYLQEKKRLNSRQVGENQMFQQASQNRWNVFHWGVKRNEFGTGV